MSGQFQDRTVVCRERTCGAEFVLTAGEQQFFAERSLNSPSRCKACRQRRKAEQQNGAQQGGQSQPWGAKVQPAPAPAPVQDVEVQHRRPFGKRGGGKGRRERDYGDYND